MDKQARAIAFYLPQYHPIPENDKWWGKGFTEWTNTAKAKPLFRGHYQPHIPADLGFYDLRLPEVRMAQAEMAQHYGIEGFCYYHYWFDGRRLLERPFNEILATGEPVMPFCLCWANATWTGVWHGCPDRILIEQTYPGRKDYIAHFNFLLNAFQDNRYIRVDNKPLFLVFRPNDIPDIRSMVDLWREMAEKSGLPGLYLVGVAHTSVWEPSEWGFDAAVVQYLPALNGHLPWRHPIIKVRSKLKKGKLSIYQYDRLIKYFIPERVSRLEHHPCVIPNWDNTPRAGWNGLLLKGSSPDLFRNQLRIALDFIAQKPSDHRFIFIKSWNEWAEGNHLEPDLLYGLEYLQAFKEEISNGGKKNGEEVF